MDWMGPDSKWREQVLRRRQRWRRAILGIVGIGAVVTITRYLSLVSLPAPAGDLGFLTLLLLGSMLGAVLLAAGTAWWWLKREERIFKAVAETNGMLCPLCHKPLEHHDNTAHCERCEQTFPAENVLIFWTEYPHSGISSYNARFPEEAKGEEKTKKRVRLAYAGMGVLMLTGLAAAKVFLAPKMPLAYFLWNDVLGILPFVLLGAAMGSLASLFVRRGKEPRCAGCGYRKPPEGPAGEQCPECGADWNVPGGTSYGRREVNRKEAVWAIGLVIVAAALIVPKWTPSSRKWLPTGLLVNEAVYSVLNDSAWAELKKRNLTAEERYELARKLLDRRLEGEHVGLEGGHWLWKQVAGQKLSDELTQRFFNEFFEARMAAPSRVSAGEPFTVRLEVEDRLMPLPLTVDDVILIEGLYVGSATEPLGRRDEPVYPLLLNNPEYAFAVQVPPQPAGKVELRLAFWFVVSNGAMRQTAGWDENGEPWFDPTVVHRRRYELSTTVTVEPPSVPSSAPAPGGDSAGGTPQ